VDVDQAAPAVVEPRVRTSEPAFATLLAAVQTGRVVTFDYRKPVPAEVRTRTVEPWGVVSWRGRWYLVGHDRDRRAARCFRLSRIVGDARTVGKAGVVEAPPGVDLMSFVKGFDDDPGQCTLARLWVAKGQAQGLRRRARLVGEDVVDGIVGDLLEIELNLPESAAGWIAGFGADVEVVEPEVLRKSVYERLLGTLAAADGKAS
jgi:proteasome accessory factor B